MIYLASDKVRPPNAIGLILGLVVIDQVLHDFGLNCGLTSMNDSEHSRTSLHYADCAADIRIRDWPADIDKSEVIEKIRQRLNRHYDVILERTHIHVEFQPRGPIA